MLWAVVRRRLIRELQHLLGHKSARTTEMYLKELIPETVRPNERPMIASSIDPKIDPKNAQKLAGAIAAGQCGIGSPTRARTWDLWINSPSTQT